MTEARGGGGEPRRLHHRLTPAALRHGSSDSLPVVVCAVTVSASPCGALDNTVSYSAGFDQVPDTLQNNARLFPELLRQQLHTRQPAVRARRTCRDAPTEIRRGVRCEAQRNDDAPRAHHSPCVRGPAARRGRGPNHLKQRRLLMRRLACVRLRRAMLHAQHSTARTGMRVRRRRR